MVTEETKRDLIVYIIGFIFGALSIWFLWGISWMIRNKIYCLFYNCV